MKLKHDASPATCLSYCQGHAQVSQLHRFKIPEIVSSQPQYPPPPHPNPINRTSICSYVFFLFSFPLSAAAEGSTCVVLCVSEPLNGVQGALLASIMDIVGLRHGNTELLTPHTHPDSLKILQNSPDSHMLQLLLPVASCESESETAPAPAPAPASATAASAKVCDAPVPLVVLSIQSTA